MLKILFLSVGMLVLFCSASAYPITETDVDTATREVDQPFREEAEGEIRTTPKKALIKIEGPVENLEGYYDEEGKKVEAPEISGEEEE
jgi:hypothetical protein